VSKRPNKTASTASAWEILRVAVISDFDRVDPAPDQLCLLKRQVDLFDQLEVADVVAWAAAVALIQDPRARKMFEGGNMDRLRARYGVYGWELSLIEATTTDLETALAG
jgi:hypothetical protein